ncbi:hypothetical protein PVAP13_9KG250013 [Panicum virgatum]|uniref:Uncharacterized protein n=1 Tax=Panicum virgatum TaxID=38727 RepID=A0A8T0NRU6_PANVG|nr:hypothetical protein PVAP13_9KG250013 [Panicum virgatum]
METEQNLGRRQRGLTLPSLRQRPEGSEKVEGPPVWFVTGRRWIELLLRLKMGGRLEAEREGRGGGDGKARARRGGRNRGREQSRVRGGHWAHGDGRFGRHSHLGPVRTEES